MTWLARVPALDALEPPARAALDRLRPVDMAKGTVLFRPGDAVSGYAIVLSGRIDVSLTSASGREILLYSVAPGQSCIQSTMGLMGGTDYSAEGMAQHDTTLVLLPKSLFLDLVESSPGFRAIVFRAFADRMQTMMHLLEKVAFQRVECRIAEHLLDLSRAGNPIHITQSELATQVGTAREVISRRLDAWARRGLVRTGRGTVEIMDAQALCEIAKTGM